MTVMIDSTRTLFEAARPHLTDADLSALTDLAEHAADDARRWSTVCDGLACIIESDSLQQGGRAGSFQSGATIGNLLAVLGSAFDAIGSKADLGDAARAELAARIKGRAGK
ncbi:conserved protein of unknown function [Thauera humireducens]|uniref:hypothetical protein n=1 Tax=Thauera humireducens TaxID=1134435 RepID=UPI002467A026|nr:hypothetical protein [Thauera humireducens]CAH1747481.1 conserved protein of unknown function [Thauera humireducens]